MIETEIIELKNGAALGFRHLLGNRPPWLLIIQGENGYLATEYINKEFASRVGDAFAIVSNASNFEEMLKGEVTWVSEKAKELGVELGMSGEEALEYLV